MKSFEGKLLIAVPDLQDTNFFRSVVLVLHHDQFGASGVVLNRPSDTRVADLSSQLDISVESESVLAKRLHVGGPVDGPVIVLHNDRDLSEQTIIPGVFMSTRKDLVEQLLSTEGVELRLFSGYSGWSPGQLENEVDLGGWLLLGAKLDHVYGGTERLWKVVCDEFGDDVLSPKAKSDAKFDPGLN